MNRKLYRSRTVRTISGVCGGLENYLGVDVTIIRLCWVLITIPTGIFPGLLAYVAAALIIPDEPVGYNPNYNNNNCCNNYNPNPNPNPDQNYNNDNQNR